MKSTQQAVAANVIIALLLSLSPAPAAAQNSGAAAPAQAVMQSDLSPERKMNCLYNGGCSAKDLAPPTAAQAAGGAGELKPSERRPAPKGVALDKGSVPSPAPEASQKQVRVGYWGYSWTATEVLIAVIVVAAIIIGANSPGPKYRCYRDYWGYERCDYY